MLWVDGQTPWKQYTHHIQSFGKYNYGYNAKYMYTDPKWKLYT